MVIFFMMHIQSVLNMFQPNQENCPDKILILKQRTLPAFLGLFYKGAYPGVFKSNCVHPYSLECTHFYFQSIP